MKPRHAQRLAHRLQTTVPPVGGLNTSGAVASMTETDAIEMDNMIATERGVTVREGWREYATGFANGVQTLMSYEGSVALATTAPMTQSVLFAATRDGIFDIEGGGSFTAATPAIALSGAFFAGRFSCVQFTTDAGQYLIACSETDGGFVFDGLTWKKMTATGTGSVNNVDPSRFVQVCAYKKRLCFVERDTAMMWVLGPGLIAGSASKFDFGPLLRNGGNVIGLVNWTQDAGYGVDDHMVIIGSAGDLLVYRGIDPTTLTGFENVGTWFIGQPPVGRRCFTESGGNVYVLTVYGVIPVTQIVQGGIDTLEVADTSFFKQLRKVQDALNIDFASLLNTVGWEVMHVTNKALLHIARPQGAVNEFIQYAFQEHNLAWSRLLDIPCETFGRRLDEVYGGTTDGRVLRVLDGSTDGMLRDGSGEHEIRARLTPAFSYFNDPTTQKQALMARVNFVADAAPGYIIAMNADFERQPPGNAPPPGLAAGALWNQSGYWDQSFWAGGRQAFGEWRSVEGLGYALAPTIYISALQPTTIATIELMVKPGGPF